jgi:hypothetical protein
LNFCQTYIYVDGNVRKQAENEIRRLRDTDPVRSVICSYILIEEIFGYSDEGGGR